MGDDHKNEKAYIQGAFTIPQARRNGKTQGDSFKPYSLTPL